MKLLAAADAARARRVAAAGADFISAKTSDRGGFTRRMKSDGRGTSSSYTFEVCCNNGHSLVLFLLSSPSIPRPGRLNLIASGSDEEETCGTIAPRSFRAKYPSTAAKQQM